MASMVPSGSTNGTALGGAIAVIILYGLSLNGVNCPPGVEAAITLVVATLAGYLPPSGRVIVPLDQPPQEKLK